MKKINIIILALFLSTLVFGLARPAYAQEGQTSPSHDGGSSTTTDNQSSASTTKADSNSSQQNRVAEKRAAIKDRLQNLKSRITMHLDGKRLEVCQKREAKINSLLQKSLENGKQHLALFQSIESGVKDFYVKKNLNSDQYDTAVATANEKEATAVAAIESMGAQTFSCQSTDGSNPGSLIKAAMEARHNAMKEYRTAIKNLIQVVKKADTSTSRVAPVTGGNQ